MYFETADLYDRIIDANDPYFGEIHDIWPSGYCDGGGGNG